MIPTRSQWEHLSWPQRHKVAKSLGVSPHQMPSIIKAEHDRFIQNQKLKLRRRQMIKAARGIDAQVERCRCGAWLHEDRECITCAVLSLHTKGQ